MDAAAIIATVISVIKTFNEVEPVLVQGWTNMQPFIKQLYSNLSGGKDITPEQEQEIYDALKVISNDLQRPIPDEEE